MYLLTFNLTLFEIIILQIGAIILGITIYFFWISNKALSAALKKSKSQLNIQPQKKQAERSTLKAGMLDLLQQQLAEFRINKTKSAPSNPATLPQHEGLNLDTIGSLKDTVLRQQSVLNSLIGKIDGLQDDASTKKELEH